MAFPAIVPLDFFQFIMRKIGGVHPLSLMTGFTGCGFAFTGFSMAGPAGGNIALAGSMATCAIVFVKIHQVSMRHVPFGIPRVRMAFLTAIPLTGLKQFVVAILARDTGQFRMPLMCEHHGSSGGIKKNPDGLPSGRLRIEICTQPEDQKQTSHREKEPVAHCFHFTYPGEIINSQISKRNKEENSSSEVLKSLGL